MKSMMSKKRLSVCDTLQGSDVVLAHSPKIPFLVSSMLAASRWFALA